jgi:hypothetical protein
MALVMGDGNRECEVMGCGHLGGWRGRRGSPMVLKVDDTTKSGTTAEEVEGGGWRSKVIKRNWVGGLNGRLD